MIGLWYEGVGPRLCRQPGREFELRGQALSGRRQRNARARDQQDVRDGKFLYPHTA